MPKLYAMSSTLGDVKQDLILLLAGADIGDASTAVDTFAEDLWGRLREANLTTNAIALGLTQQRTLDTVRHHPKHHHLPRPPLSQPPGEHETTLSTYGVIPFVPGPP